MNRWIMCLCAVGWVSVSGLSAQSEPVATNRAEKINTEIRTLLQEETALRGESRTLSMQLQNFAAELGTNHVALTKLHQQWRAAQDQADALRAELQGQIESSSEYKALKARRDAAEGRMLEIRTRVRDLMKERGLESRGGASRK